MVNENQNGVMTDIFTYDKVVLPMPEKQHEWEVYSKQLKIEYDQCIEEGLDLEAYKDVIMAVADMPDGNDKEAMANVIYHIVANAKTKEDYAYVEPSDLEGIKAQRRPHTYAKKDIPTGDALAEKIAGAWYGRICGCLLGKPVEGCRVHELVPFLKDTGNYPMHRYIMQSDVTEEIDSKYNFDFIGAKGKKTYPDVIKFAPVDDDTNYVVLAQLLIKRYGRDFAPRHMAEMWIRSQSKNAYCTAERVAFRNFINGFRPPYSAVYKNPYREWIGAQIRGDYFGYINPGNPELAAEMAWRDAAISHVKNGIYGEMFAAAMIAQAAVESDIEKIIEAGLAQVPATSRLYESVMKVVDGWKNGMNQQDCHEMIHRDWNENTTHGWCHTVSNAMIVTMALLYGEGDYSRSICMAVQTCFDTDCNGATVGSILGMRDGSATVGDEWTKPINGRLKTTIFGVGMVELADMASKTMEHMK